MQAIKFSFFFGIFTKITLPRNFLFGILSKITLPEKFIFWKNVSPDHLTSS